MLHAFQQVSWNCRSPCIGAAVLVQAPSLLHGVKVDMSWLVPGLPCTTDACAALVVAFGVAQLAAASMCWAGRGPVLMCGSGISLTC